MNELTRRELLTTGVATGLSVASLTTGKLVSAQESAAREQWAFDTGGAIDSSPTVVDGTVYVGSDDRTLYTIDAATGDQQWAFNTAAAVKSSPSVVDDTVYVGSNAGYLYAIDTDTSIRRWLFGTDGKVVSSPTVVSGTVYVGSRNWKLHAVDEATGDLLWEFESAGWVDSSPTVVDGTVYVGSYGGDLYAVDGTDGNEQWTVETGDSIQSSPTVANGTVYAGSFDGYLYAIDAETGDEKWRFETGNKILSSPTVADDIVYIGGSDDYLYAIDTETGDQRWAFDAGYVVDSSPTVAGTTAYVGSYNNTLYAVDVTDGTERWSFRPSGGAHTDTMLTPTVTEGTVYVGSSDGTLYAVDAGMSAKSDGSRVLLGTVGHHGTRTDRIYGFDGSATFTISPSEPVLGQEVTFDASPSTTASDRTLERYQWAFGTDEAFRTEGKAVTHTFRRGTEHTVRLRVTDSLGATVTTSEEVTLVAPPDPVIERRPAEPRAGEQFTLDASNSEGEGARTIDSYEWAIGEGSDFDRQGEQITHVFEERGSYTVSLRVTDSDGITATTEQTIDVAPVPMTTTETTAQTSNDTGTIDETVLTAGAALGVTTLGGIVAYRRLDSDTDNAVLDEWPRPGQSAMNTATAPDSRAVEPDARTYWTTDVAECNGLVVTDDAVVTSHDDGTLVATESQTGHEKWQTTVGTNATTAPAIEFGSAYVASGTTVTAVDYRTGSTEWTERFDSPLRGTPVPYEDTLFVGCRDGTVAAVNAKSGTNQWETELDAAVRGAVAVTDNRVVSSSNRTVTAIDSTSGEINWTTTLRGELCQPTVVDDSVYVVDRIGTLSALALDGGNVCWTVETGVSEPQRVAATETTVWVAGESGRLVAVTADGEKRWTTTTESDITATPRVIDDTVYVATGLSVVGFDATTGTQAWSVSLHDHARALAPTSTALYVGTANGVEGYQSEQSSENWGPSPTDDQQSNDAVATTPPASASPTDTDQPPLEREVEKLSDLERIATGDGTTTYRGQHVAVEGPVRVIALSPAVASEATATAFTQTVNGWYNANSHHAVVSIHDRGETPRPWVAIEEVDGTPLRARQPDLTVADSVAVLADAAEAVYTAGLYNATHTALSPDCIWVSNDGQQYAGTVGEWGLSRAIQNTLGKDILTPYTAPEQLSSDGSSPSTQTDVYGLGAVAYYALTGQQPVAAERNAILSGDITAPNELAAVPDDITDVVMCALNTDPADRYDSIYGLKESLLNTL